MACLVRDVRVLNPQRLNGVLSSENGMQTSRLGGRWEHKVDEGTPPLREQGF